MTTTHKMISWTAGDDWEIDATLLREDGMPYDLTGPHTIKWALLDDISGGRVLDETDVTITTVNALAGQIAIKIAASLSSPLFGRYTDTIRIVYAGTTSTLATGAISVHRDPWLAAHAVAATDAPPRLELVKSGGILAKIHNQARAS